ncbi:MAG: hypothetical protein ABR498_02640 [Candidatus Dormibacteria bacterium]
MSRERFNPCTSSGVIPSGRSVWADFWCLSGLLRVVAWPPRAVATAGVSGVSEPGDGRGERPRPLSPSGAELLNLGLAIALAVVIPLGAGVGIDALAHSSPIGFLVGLLIGIVAASVFVVALFRRYL